MDTFEGKKETKISDKFGKVDLKEQKEEYYSKGYIATTHTDSVGDKIQKATLDKWAQEINDTTESKADNVSIHHDRADLNLAGRGAKGTARVEELDDGESGLWVETHHNKTHPKFADTVYQIDNGFLSHYSIEYDTHEDSTVHREQTDDGWVRFIEPDTDLVGYGLASPRTVVNENAAMSEAGYKELLHLKEKGPGGHKPNGTGPHGRGNGPGDGKADGSGLKKGENMEDKKVDDKKKKLEDEKKKMEEKKEEQPAPPAEEKKEEPKEEAPVEEKKVDAKEIAKSVMAEIKAELKETEPEVKPMINKKEKIEAKEEKVELKELTSYKEAVVEKKSPVDVRWKEAAKLHNAMVKEGHTPIGTSTGKGAFEVKENKIQYKTLTTDVNYVGAQTSYVDALDNYEQTPAALNDIYGPVIIDQMNEETTTWNLLPKDEMSGGSAIRFRVRDSANATAGFYAYGSTPGWDSYTGMYKYNTNFVTAYVEVAVEFEEMELANAPGGIGDVYAKEIQYGSSALMSKLNVDLLQTSTAASESQPYTFETTIITSGNLYGKDVSTKTLMAAGGKDNMSSAPITLKKLRDMADAVLKNGAKRTDLVYIANHTQVTKILTLVQSIQRTVPTSARVGFEGQPELDGIPIFRDKDANTDDIFLIDQSSTRIGIKKAPTYQEFGLTELKRKGIVWMMYNLYCTNPNHNYWIYGLQTT